MCARSGICSFGAAALTVFGFEFSHQLQLELALGATHSAPAIAASASSASAFSSSASSAGLGGAGAGASASINASGDDSLHPGSVAEAGAASLNSLNSVAAPRIGDIVIPSHQLLGFAAPALMASAPSSISISSASSALLPVAAAHDTLTSGLLCGAEAAAYLALTQVLRAALSRVTEMKSSTNLSEPAENK